MKFFHQFSNPPVYTGKKMSDETITVPDQTLTIRQIMTQHTRGVGVDSIQKQGEYFDTDIPVFDDITDVADYKRSLDEKNSDLQNDIAILEAENKRRKSLKHEMVQDSGNSGDGSASPPKTD